MEGVGWVGGGGPGSLFRRVLSSARSVGLPAGKKISASPRAGAAPVAISFKTNGQARDIYSPAPLLQPIDNTIMLWTIAVIFLVLWAVGLVSHTAIGGFVHVLLVVAVIVILAQIIMGRKPSL